MDDDSQANPTTRRLVALARAMIAGRLSFIEGSRAIGELIPGDLRNDPDVIAFILVDSETDTLPLGEQQNLWRPEALEKLKPRIDQAEQWAKDVATPHCHNLIIRFG